mgnify:CR=1 FL=1
MENRYYVALDCALEEMVTLYDASIGMMDAVESARLTAKEVGELADLVKFLTGLERFSKLTPIQTVVLGFLTGVFAERAKQQEGLKT